MIRYINVGVLVLLLQAVSMAGPTAKELLDKFTETVDKAHTSFIAKSKTKMVSEGKLSGKLAYRSGRRTVYFLQEFRTDGQRIKRIWQMWGDFMGSAGKYVFTPESEKSYHNYTYDGKQVHQYSRGNNNTGKVIIDPGGPKKGFTIDAMLAYDDHVSGCFGYFEGDLERFDRILRKAGPGQVSVRDKMEDLNGTAHYVIDAKINRGRYTIWLNPEKGYNLSKAVVLREPGDLWRGSHKIEIGHKNTYLIETTQFIDVNGVWLPAKAKMRSHAMKPDGYYVKFTRDIELTSILINPDHDALDSFFIDDIKGGARVFFAGRGGTHFQEKHTWNDGKVLDRKGREIYGNPGQPPPPPYKLKDGKLVDQPPAVYDNPDQPPGPKADSQPATEPANSAKGPGHGHRYPDRHRTR